MDGSLPAQDLFFVEWFSGVEAPTKAFNKGGFAAAGYDIGKDPIKMNILSKDGFLEAIRLGRRLRPHEGLQHFATVCSTWALALDILSVFCPTVGRNCRACINTQTPAYWLFY